MIVLLIFGLLWASVLLYFAGLLLVAFCEIRREERSTHWAPSDDRQVRRYMKEHA